ncbi:MAG: biotin--[acetyl-CoA-carboxylase] ligase [Bifidobacteriaceae bacterium]|nr:biotin--[acetyl-CoA-carboxylase] ligase [Bifidobacteriaceae bacterium]
MALPLDATRLTECLVAQGPYVEVQVVAETGSTNQDLLAHAANLPHLTARLAEHQSRGRGRLHPGEASPRRWQSPPGRSILASVLFRPPAETPLPKTLAPLAFAWAVLGALDLVVPTRLALKWPNDIVASAAPPPGDDAVQPVRAPLPPPGDGAFRSGPAPTADAVWPVPAASRLQKLAGLLAQVAPSGEVVVGIGLNVSQTAVELPKGAASLATLGAPGVDRTWLAGVALTAAAGAWERWARGDEKLVDGIGQRMETLGREVAVGLADGTVARGRAGRLRLDGALELFSAAGDRQIVTAGEVEA